jgi:CDP-6-deoxy-D-xylo-4-hexulose-3-dehydrase
MVDFMESKLIQTRSYFKGKALLHPAYEELAKEHTDPRNTFPIATKTTLDTFFLGVYPGITDEQLDYIETVVEEFINKHK